MHALLFAVSLQIGTLKEPVGAIEINREIVLEAVSAADLRGYEKKRVGGIDIYTKSTKSEDEDHADFVLDVFVRSRGKLFVWRPPAGPIRLMSLSSRPASCESSARARRKGKAGPT